MPSYAKQLKWKDAPQSMGPRRMSFLGALAAIAFPIVIQILCVIVLSFIDPCRNNPGCMTGSITAYAAILVIPASLLVLIFAAIFERAIGRISARNAIVVNSVVALVPFALIFGILVFNS